MCWALHWGNSNRWTSPVQLKPLYLFNVWFLFTTLQQYADSSQEIGAAFLPHFWPIINYYYIRTVWIIEFGIIITLVSINNRNAVCFSRDWQLISYRLVYPQLRSGWILFPTNVFDLTVDMYWTYPMNLIWQYRGMVMHSENQQQNNNNAICTYWLCREEHKLNNFSVDNSSQLTTVQFRRILPLPSVRTPRWLIFTPSWLIFTIAWAWFLLQVMALNAFALTWLAVSVEEIESGRRWRDCGLRDTHIVAGVYGGRAVGIHWDDMAVVSASPGALLLQLCCVGWVQAWVLAQGWVDSVEPIAEWGTVRVADSMCPCI